MRTSVAFLPELASPSFQFKWPIRCLYQPIILVSFVGGYADLLGDKRTVRLPSTEHDLRLTRALHDRGFVGKIKEDKNGITVYIKRVGRG